MERLKTLVYEGCLRLVRRLWTGDEEKKRQLARDLDALGAGQERQTPEEFCAEGLCRAAAVLLAGGALLGAVLLAGSLLSGDPGLSAVRRPGYGEGAKETELSVRMEGESEKTAVTVSVSGRRYTKAEAEAVLDRAEEGLKELLLSENKSLDEVRTALNLPETLEGGTVRAVWTVTPGGVVSYDGTLAEEIPEAGVTVQIRAELACQEAERLWSVYARILPRKLSREEERQAELSEALSLADAASAEEEQLRLPKEAGGRRLFWEEPRESFAGTLAALPFLCAAAVYFRRREELKKELRLRQRQLVMDYPGLLFKMAMLLGAGLTIQGAFFRIAREYRGRQEKEVRYAYEEVARTCFEIRNGVGEARAYENFGLRCGNEAYRRLGSILSQNLKKGAKGLIAVLETEAAEGLEGRKQQARKLGEEAGTRLLLPMMMMFVLVMGILVVPAVMGM